MKKGVLILIAILSLACKEKEKATEITEAPEHKLTLLDSIANAYGFQHWKAVDRISFTFNVQRPDRPYGRTWTWDTRKNEVTSIMEGDTITYLRKEVDSTLIPVDARFINDKYWLLVPFNLVWDRDNFTHTVTDSVRGPLSGKMQRKLTIVYGEEGGYTPGDAYDFYVGKDLIIDEWAWRRGNDTVPTIQNKWERPTNYEGLLLTEKFQDPEGNVRIFFSDINVRRATDNP